jgi:hypothetical protein
MPGWMSQKYLYLPGLVNVTVSVFEFVTPESTRAVPLYVLPPVGLFSAGSNSALGLTPSNQNRLPAKSLTPLTVLPATNSGRSWPLVPGRSTVWN